MSSQIFKHNVPIKMIIDFLNANCEAENGFHIFSKVLFRKAQYHNRIKPFCELIREYYHISKRYYIERQMNYAQFSTVLRQLCKSHNLPYTSRIIYDKSSYDIIYYINTNNL